MTTNFILKTIAALLGGAMALFTPLFPLLWVCTAFVLADCYSAFALSRRVRKTNANAKAGKFRSDYAKRIFKTLLEIFSVLVLAHILDRNIFVMFDGLYLANYLAGVFCVVQLWSVLENTSSCNDARWAKVLQKVMIDKTQRHLDIDLSQLIDKQSPQ